MHPNVRLFQSIHVFLICFLVITYLKQDCNGLPALRRVGQRLMSDGLVIKILDENLDKLMNVGKYRKYTNTGSNIYGKGERLKDGIDRQKSESAYRQYNQDLNQKVQLQMQTIPESVAENGGSSLKQIVVNPKPPRMLRFESSVSNFKQDAPNLNLFDQALNQKKLNEKQQLDLEGFKGLAERNENAMEKLYNEEFLKNRREFMERMASAAPAA